MFEKNNEIIKVYGTGKLMAVKLWSMNNSRKKNASDPDYVVKAKVEVATFDPNNQQGGKIKDFVNIYMDLDKLSYFATMLRTFGIKAVQTNIAIQQGIQRQKPPAAQIFEDYGGSEKNGAVTSRSLKIATGGPEKRADFFVTVDEAPGTRGDKGQIIRTKGAQSTKWISMALSAESAIEIAAACERAMSIFDMWTAMGTVAKNLERINPPKDAGNDNQYRPQQPRQQYGAGQQSGYAAQGGYAADAGYGQPQQGGYYGNGYANQAF